MKLKDNIQTESNIIAGNTITALGGNSTDWNEAHAKTAPFTVTASKVIIDRDLEVTGNITASADVIAYVAGAVSGTVLDALSVSTPLVKTGTNVALNLNPSHFNTTGGQLNYIGTVGMTSVQWSDIQSKPSTFTPSTHSHSYLPLAGGTLTGALTIAGSGTYGSYPTSSAYVTGADNIVLKGNSAGVSGIFFESSKAGVAINHPTDFGFIQFHSYGIGGTTGEANRLVIGVSNDADDIIVMNPMDTNGLKVRVGAATTEHTVYHAGNLSKGTLGLGNVDNTADASKSVAYAKKLNVNTSGSISDLNIVSTEQGVLRFDTFNGTGVNMPPTSGNNANGVITMLTNHGSEYGKQIGFRDNDDLFIRRLSGNVYGNWYKLYHPGNSNLSTIDWDANNISAAGIISAGSIASSYGNVTLDGSTIIPAVYFGKLNSYIKYEYNGNEAMILNSRYSASHYEFRIGDVEKVRIESNGTLTSTGLQVNGNANVTGNLSLGSTIYLNSPSGSNYDDWTITNAAGGALNFTKYSSVNVNFGSSGKLTCNGIQSNGSIVSSAEITAFSDRRLKSNIQPLRLRGDLQPVTYIKDNKPSIGFIAQDVRTLYPELVVGDESKEMLSLNYQQLTAVLYSEIIELKKQIKQLQL